MASHLHILCYVVILKTFGSTKHLAKMAANEKVIKKFNFQCLIFADIIRRDALGLDTPMSEDLMNKVNLTKRRLPVLSDLRTEALKERHWKQVEYFNFKFLNFRG
jgi:hypothetical protein